MGMDINVHDQWAVESPGPIADRTKEHLGYSDRVIIAARQLMFRAIDDVAEGRDPPGIASPPCGPPTIDAVGPADGLGTLLARPGSGAAANNLVARAALATA